MRLYFVFVYVIMIGFEVAIGVSRTFLRIFGIWPDPKRKENWLSHSHFLIVVILMVYFINLPQTIMAARVWGNFNAVLEVLTVSDIPTLISVSKTIGIWYNRNGTYSQMSFNLVNIF